MLFCVNIPGLRAGGDPVPASGIICALSVSPRPKQTRLCQEVHPATQTSPIKHATPSALATASERASERVFQKLYKQLMLINFYSVYCYLCFCIYSSLVLLL